MDLHVTALTLLRLLAICNNPVQKRLFDRVSLVLTLPHCVDGDAADTTGQDKLASARASVLAEVFTNGKELSLLVDEPTIHRIMAALADAPVAERALLDVLQAIIMVEELDLPLRRNQSFIMKYLPQFRDKLYLVCGVCVRQWSVVGVVVHQFFGGVMSHQLCDHY